MKKLINKIDWSLFFAFANIISVFYLVCLAVSQTKTVTELEGKNQILQTTIDSCINSNFEENITNGRYEITLEIFRERNPKAAEQFEEIMSHETE
jgi:hypothetical protein